MKYIIGLIIALFFTIIIYMFSGEDPLPETIDDIKIISYPLEINPDCDNGRAKIFDECSNQLELYEIARQRAKDENKTLLVSYGAEWCIWCHVFDKYIRGDHIAFTHTFSDEDDEERFSETFYERPEKDVKAEARELAQFVADNFVIVHIEYKYSQKSDDVLDASGAYDYYDDNLPFIYTVDEAGKFAMAFNRKGIEVRRDSFDWYRGYDRKKMQQELGNMRDAAR